jgi:hypothetical protein
LIELDRSPACTIDLGTHPGSALRWRQLIGSGVRHVRVPVGPSLRFHYVGVTGVLRDLTEHLHSRAPMVSVDTGV